MGKNETRNKWRETAMQPHTRGSRKAAAVMLFLLSLVPLSGAVSAAEGIRDECRLLLGAGAQKKITDNSPGSPGMALEIQRGLATVYAGNPLYESEQKATKRLSDGRIGTETRAWLMQFCSDYPVYAADSGLPDAVMRSVRHYAEVAAGYPGWKQIINSPEFDTWIRSNPDADWINTRQLRRSGAAPVLIKLLEEFTAARAETTVEVHAAVDGACDLLLGGGRNNRIPARYLSARAIGRQIQQGLQAVFGGRPEYQSERERSNFLFDGRIGRETRKWLQRFCQDLPVSGSLENLPENVMRSVLHYAEIDAARPDWRKVITNPDFNRWVMDRVPQGEPDNRRLRLSGSAPIVIELLEQYPGKPGPPPDPPHEDCPPETAAGPARYYALSEQDWTRLKEREGLLDQVKGLTEKKFDTEDELDKAIAATADKLGNRCVRTKFLKTIQANRQAPTRVFLLTQKSLDQLHDQLIPPAGNEGEAEIRFVDEILSELEGIKEKAFESQGKLTRNVRFLARKVQFKVKRALEGGGNDTAKDRKTLKPESENGANDAPEEETPPKRELDGGADTAAEDESSLPPGPPGVQIEALVKQVVAAAETQEQSGISPLVVDLLKKDPLFATLPEEKLEKLRVLLGVAYVNEALYETAVRVALDPRPSIEEVRVVVAEARKTGDANARLDDVTAADNCGCARQWDTVLKERFVVYGLYPSWLSAADPEKVHREDGEPAEQAKSEPSRKDDVVAVNFGILSRIGYFALTLNQEGKIADFGQWSKQGGAREFIRLAHKHLSKVDLVIEARYWQSWEESALGQAVEEIGRLLRPDPPRLTAAMIPDGVTLYFPGFARSDPQKQKGIVKLLKRLHAKLTSDDGAGQRNSLLGKIRRGLGAGGSADALSLNILIDADSFEIGSKSTDPGKQRLFGELKYLSGLRDVLIADKESQEKPVVDLVLVLLGQPVTDTKKKLRLAIENEFEGQTRIDVLRRILPVIPPNGHKEGDPKVSNYAWGAEGDPYRRLHHDLLYFRDNFRGVAFWPTVPETMDEEALAQWDEVRKRLINTFEQSDEPGAGHQVGEFMGYDPCLFVCPNRSYLTGFFFLFLTTLIVLALLAYWCCRLRGFLARHLLLVLVIVALLILMFVTFITCVPNLQDRQNSILMWLVVILIGSWLIYYIRKVKQGPLP